MLYFVFFFFFSSRRRHTRYIGDWSSDVCSSDLMLKARLRIAAGDLQGASLILSRDIPGAPSALLGEFMALRDRKSTRLNSSHRCISYAVFCLKKKKKIK